MSGSAADVVDFEVPDYEIIGPLTRLFKRREQRGIASLPGRLETGSR
jgi:hypothetical protein